MSTPATLTQITGMEPHPNADTLSLLELDGLAYQVIGKTSEWSVGDEVVYVEPDSILPAFTQYEWLGLKAKHRRIRATKIRGLYSMGLVIRPQPDELAAMDGWAHGTDVSEIMGITHYQPPVKSASNPHGERPGIDPPFIDFGRFTVENIQRYGDVIPAGEAVLVTEKLHGQNVRCSRHEGVTLCGTRKVWFPENGHPCWNMMKLPGMDAMLTMFQDVIFYWERLNVQGSKWSYDCASGEDDYRLISVRNKDDGAFWPFHAVATMADAYDIKTVPVIWSGEYDRQIVTDLAEGPSVFGSQSFREGVVVQRRYHKGVPCFLKSINPQYLAGK
jgi:hypothetical protein